MRRGEFVFFGILCLSCVASVTSLFAAAEGVFAIDQPLRFYLWALASLIIGATLVYVCWRIPTLTIGDLDDQKNLEVTAQNELRKTLIQAVGGILIIIGFYFSWKTLETTRIQNDQTARSTIDAQITERFTKAIDQLGAFAGKDKNLPIRVGGIYDLERVAESVHAAHEGNTASLSAAQRKIYQDADLRDYFRTIALLAGYVRSEFRLSALPASPRSKSYFAPPDEQAALIVIGYLNAKYDFILDLCYTDLSGADLRGLHLNQIDLDDADFRNALFSNTTLAGAALFRSDFDDVDLDDTDLEGADLDGASLRRTTLTKTKMKLACLWNTHLDAGASITQQQARSACGNDATTLPADWPTGVQASIRADWHKSSACDARWGEWK
jgi:uncharacterized protein YjbI with pentapeptide repeats